MRKNIKELDIKSLEELLLDWDEKKFHARQILSWIYKKGALDFDAMSDLSLGLREKLKGGFLLLELELEDILESCDGTKKLVLKTRDGDYIESVAIPAERRLTGCVSTQLGCKFKCSFCASGAAGFERDLAVSEILEQILYIKNNSDSNLTHIVFMGIGEPLDNYENLLKAIRIINSENAFGIGARRITVSTCGIIPAIKRLGGENMQIELSVSLHASDDEKRSSIMPVNRVYRLKELIVACREYAERTKRQVTFEYVLVKGLNSGLPDARNLCKILKDFESKVNLIPINPGVCAKWAAPSRQEVISFKDYLLEHGLNATLRRPRGEDIKAACGQLRLKRCLNEK